MESGLANVANVGQGSGGQLKAAALGLAAGV